MSEEASVFEQWCPDGICFSRVAVSGPTLLMHLEPAAQRLTGSQIAERLMACNDVAYLSGRVKMRTEFEKEPDRRSLDGFETQTDLNAATRHLESLSLDRVE
ncbi:hypothetical protein ONA92_26330 [Mycobacteroides salmoniphilum]|uniref:hypothetical protein n=1 Tax=Mycobacteroides salmoniphilum TaxID=404941 RepID=UPI0035670E79